MGRYDPHADPLEGLKAVLEQRVLPELAPRFRTATLGEWPGTGLANELPYVSLDEVSSSANELRAFHSIAVDVFAATRADAILLAGAINVRLLGYPGGVLLEGGHWFKMDDVACSKFPAKGDWDDKEIRRQSAIYEFSVRR